MLFPPLSAMRSSNTNLQTLIPAAAVTAALSFVVAKPAFGPGHERLRAVRLAGQMRKGHAEFISRSRRRS